MSVPAGFPHPERRALEIEDMEQRSQGILLQGCCIWDGTMRWSAVVLLLLLSTR